MTPRVCSVDGCDRQAYVEGRSHRCNKHNHLKRTYGDVHHPPATLINVEPRDRILTYSRLDEATDCWLWIKQLDKRGYGRATVTRKYTMTGAHRVSYEAFREPIPDGLVIDHVCRNPRCVNPYHLDVVTTGENTRRHFALQTHCSRGHLFDAENTIIGKRGRICRACISIRNRAHREKDPEAHRARCRAYREKHLEESRARNRSYREKDPEAARARCREYYWKVEKPKRAAARAALTAAGEKP